MSKEFSKKLLIKICYYATIILAILFIHTVIYFDNFVWIFFLAGMIVCDTFKDILEGGKW